MSESKTTVVNNFASAEALLGVLFVGLKLCGIIDWSWWWVTLPFWASIAILLAILLACGLFLLAEMFIAWLTSWWR